METSVAQEILEAFERCQQRYPTVQLPIEKFQARVGEILSSETHLAGDEGWIAAFAKIHHEDLFLATACANDDRVAWEHFADDYLPLLRSFATQACRNSSDGEDLAQEIATKLLKEKHRLAGYNGRGSLAGWLRVAVSHAAVDRFRRTKKQTSLEDLDNPASLASPTKDDDEESLDSHWGPVISDIANECLGKFSNHDRLLLGLYYLQSVPLKDIGRQFGIHEATAYRWLDRMRHEIKKQVERELRKKYRLSAREMETLWKWVSPSSFAEAIAGPPGNELTPEEAGGHLRKKPAKGESSGVIKKEELR
jgi:RNA polymerase sigma-70 factor